MNSALTRNYFSDNLYQYMLNVFCHIEEYNQEEDIKLLSILKKGMDILGSDVLESLTISQDEEYLFDSVKQITAYVTTKEYARGDVNYLYSLLTNFLDYVENKIQYNAGIITQKEYYLLFDQYHALFLSHEKEFIENVLDKEDYQQFEDLIFNNATELALEDIEEKHCDSLTVDEFLEKLEKC